jgi:pSer/pThr/pTyr-binding forkhead associated (FHA) protein
MSSAQRASDAPSKAPIKVTVTIQSGPNAGQLYQLIPPQISIGRSPENDIVLSDVRCSREQAILHISSERFYVEDVSSRKNTLLNGSPADQKNLSPGDLILIGDTTLVFNAERAPIVIAAPAPNYSAGYLTGPTAAERIRQTPTQSSNGLANGRVRFYLIVGVLGFLFYWFLFGSQSQKLKDRIGLRSTEEIEKDIKSSEKRFDEVAKLKRFSSEEERLRYEEAQKYYLMGFRDYEDGQYARALRSFETARAILPNHELANRYSVLAERKRDEAITLNMVEGRRYKEKFMFSRCSSALEKVLDEIGNDQDIRYKESLALKNECDLMMQRKY